MESIRREEGVQAPLQRLRLRRRGQSTGLPTKASGVNHLWSWGFVSDCSQGGGKLRVFNLIDEHTHHTVIAYMPVERLSLLMWLKFAESDRSVWSSAICSK